MKLFRQLRQWLIADILNSTENRIVTKASAMIQGRNKLGGPANGQWSKVNTSGWALKEVAESRQQPWLKQHWASLTLQL